MRKRDLFIILVCALSIWVSIDIKGEYALNSSLLIPLNAEQFENGQYPKENELLPLPLVIDTDNDGKNEIVYATRDCVLSIVDPIQNKIKASTTLVSSVGMMVGRKPVGLGYGYLSNGGDLVIIVVTDSWVVLAFTNTLKLIWESHAMDEVPKGFYHTEVAITVSSVSLRSGDKGLVVVGGRMEPLGINKDKALEHEHHKFEKDSKEDSKKEDVNNFKEEVHDSEEFHFSYFGFDGKTGNLRWKHERGDFYSEGHHSDREEDENSKHAEDSFTEHSYKLHVFTQAGHLGEVDWRQYKHDLFKHLPHSWDTKYDTTFDLAHFSKKVSSGKSKNEDVTNFGIDVSGLSFSSSTPSSDLLQPNVIVVHLQTGLEVIHLSTGRTLVRLSLPSSYQNRFSKTPQSKHHILYTDLNNDNVLDQVHSLVGWESDYSSLGLEKNENQIECTAMVLSGIPVVERLFNGTICPKGVVTNSLNFYLWSKNSPGSTSSSSNSISSIQTVKPAIIPSRRNSWLTENLPSSKLYDTVFMISTGLVSCYSSQGFLRWQTETIATWPLNANSPPAHPSIISFSPRVGDKSPDHLLIVGSSIVLLSNEGKVVASVYLTSKNTAGKSRVSYSITPPVIADFNNDGINDILVITAHDIHGYIIQTGGSTISYILSLLLVCVVISLIVAIQLFQTDNSEKKRFASLIQRHAIDSKAL
eukprot:TRINITY_DN5452_c0_g1_i1.p1 TRINITY_DN5452_c0_g1~~TRINITY_DN5452_c0_g1_i1.p1  ORF type:complete len:697 (-),score=147.44 TRINITY_DN5452_c0_g1_i1:355-2445(-)